MIKILTPLERAERRLAEAKPPTTAEDKFSDLLQKRIDLQGATRLNRFITQDHDMAVMKSVVVELIEEDCPVLITGPSGTGKQIIAESLHGKREGKFVDVNCAAIPENLAESLLFGHVKGAFTGAANSHVGFFGEANGGTLFLDEIHALPKQVQYKVLKAVEYGYYVPVGAPVPGFNIAGQKNFRVVAATNRNLEDNPDFLLDLYARLATFEVKITGLSERRDDAALILASFECTKPIHDWVWNRIEKYNVRALQAYADQCRVFGNVTHQGKYLE